MKNLSDIQDFYNFKANGINADLTQEEKEKLIKLNDEMKSLSNQLSEYSESLSQLNITPTKTFSTRNNKTFTRQLIATDLDYTIKQQAKIFSHGRTNYNIWFLNRKKKVCKVKYTNIYKDTIYVTVIIDIHKYQKETKMSLDRFLYLVEIGDFVITNKQFNFYYMKPYKDSNYFKTAENELKEKIQQTELQIKMITSDPFYLDMKNKYEEKEQQITQKYNEIRQTIKPDRLILHDAKEEIKNKKLKKAIEHNTLVVQDIWNTILTGKQQAYFLGWLCKHIRRITIKVLENGVSDKLISAAYPDNIYGVKYKEKESSKGWDAASGTLSFDTIENAPIDILKVLCSKQNTNKNLFKGNKLSNLALTLFILSTCYKYGLVSGKKFKENDIDCQEIRNIIIDTDSFDKGYNS